MDVVYLAQCVKCGVAFTPKNFGIRKLQRTWHICLSCLRDYDRQWERNNPKRKDRIIKHNKYRQLNFITRMVNGIAKLEYHHWSDEDFSKGLWLCWGCHQFAERVDKGLAQKYVKLKESINGMS